MSMIYLASTVRTRLFAWYIRLQDLLFLGARRKCEEIGIKLLGDIPLHPQICTDADAGRPSVVANPESSQAQAFRSIADQLKVALNIG